MVFLTNLDVLVRNNIADIRARCHLKLLQEMYLFAQKVISFHSHPSHPPTPTQILGLCLSACLRYYVFYTLQPVFKDTGFKSKARVRFRSLGLDHLASELENRFQVETTSRGTILINIGGWSKPVLRLGLKCIYSTNCNLS